MAIAFANMSIHTRTRGHSAVAGAAYRAGIKLHDERTNEIHNFENRTDVKYKNIMLPENANEKFLDRQYLWNQVEACEKRKDSQVAKDIMLALPKDMDLDKQIELTRRFADDHFVSHGVVADVAIHDHGDGNPHAHVYITTRRLLGDRFDTHKARDLNPEFGKGFVMTQDFWSEKWGKFQNDFFKEKSIDLRVDANHIIPQKHEGRIRGKEAHKEIHYVKEENQIRRQASIEIAVNDPASLLNILGAKYGVFSDREIGSLISKNTETIEQYQTAMTKLKAHPQLITLGPGDDGRNRYTSKANYVREAHMGDNAKALMLNKEHRVSNAYIRKTSNKFSLNEEQTIALDYMAKSGAICAVVGRAGTGKTYLMKAANHMWEKRGFNVRGMAVSGKAAKGLEAEAGIASTTIHSIKTQIAYGSLKVGAKDVFVMDEAGMTNLYDMSIMVQLAKSTGAKLVVIGDSSQLQPIGAGAPFRAIVEQTGFSELNEIMRQHDAGDRGASVKLSQGDIATAIDYYSNKGQVYLARNERNKQNEQKENNAIEALVNDWSQDLTNTNIHEKLILAYRNIDVAALNQAARKAMIANGLIQAKSHKVQVADHKLELAPCDRIIFLLNNKTLGINNGEFATVEKIAGDKITVKTDNNNKLTFSSAEYNAFNYGYAATVHKAQGVTVDNAYVYVSGFWDKFLTYVALTRHRKHLSIYTDTQFKDMDALKQNLSRGSLKDTVLDWPISYAIRRGFDPEGIIGRFINKVAEVKQSIKDKWLFITNYEAYLQQKKHREKLQSKRINRENAKKVATFIDMQRDLSLTWARMRKNIKSDQKIYEHADYQKTYQQTLIKNKLAHEIYKDIDNYKPSLSRNNISLDKIKGLAKSHEDFERAEQYIDSYKQNKQNKQEDRQKIAKEIKENDIDKHFGVLAYLCNKNKLRATEINNHIKNDAIKREDIILDKHIDKIAKEFLNRDDIKADIKKLVELDNKLPCSKAITEYTVLVNLKTKATDKKMIAGYGKQLNEKAMLFFNNKGLFDEIKTKNPTVANAIKVRATHVLSKQIDKGHGFER